MAERVTAATVAAIEDMTAAAYLDLADGPQDWVRLVHLRRYLTDYHRADVDAVLVAMTQTGLVHLVPDSNRKALTDEDHDAAIRIGSEDKHLFCIEDDYFED